MTTGSERSDARDLALAALGRGVYLLDRGLAPSQKIRAFQAAMDTVSTLAADEIVDRVNDRSMTDLPSIGPSTGKVISAAVLGQPNDYLDDLDRSTRQVATIGASLREAIRGDLHCHTTWSDGGASILDMASAAMSLGHDYVAITDHSPRLTIAHGLSPERLSNQLDDIAILNRELAPFRILTGAEVDILLDGSLDLPEEILARLDIVVASVHSKLSMPEVEMTRRLVLAAASPHVDILGHCTGRKVMGTGRAPSRFDPDLVFAACAQFGTAIEVNCRPERQDPPVELLEQAVDWGCLISIDTDAHAPGQLEWQPSGCDKVAGLGVEIDRVINTWNADELISWTTSRLVGS